MPTEITITAYKFNELDERAKSKVREWYCENAMHHEWWDCVYETAKEDGLEKGFDIEDIRFSGFWSQGDGAHWTGRVDMMEFVEKNLDDSSAWYGEDIILIELWRNGWIDRFIQIHNQSYRYCHSGGMRMYEYPNHSLDLEPDDDATLTQGVMQGANIYQLTQAFNYEQRINEWCDEALEQARIFADDIYKKLRDEYEHYTSDECIADTCDVNEWLFNEEGRMV